MNYGHNDNNPIMNANKNLGLRLSTFKHEKLIEPFHTTVQEIMGEYKNAYKSYAGRTTII